MQKGNTKEPEISASAVLNVTDLSVTYSSRRGHVEAVKSVSLSLQPSETVAIVGESGSGKSTIVSALLGILPQNAHHSGKIEIAGKDLTDAGATQWLTTRKKDIGFIPQDPQTSLDPTMRIGLQLAHVVSLKEHTTGAETKKRVRELMDDVGFDDPVVRGNQYPHELSGGLKQRALIASALAGSPRLILADEPTSALDVTVQRVVLDVLNKLARERGIALLMITHDLAVASERVQRLVVIQQGKVVESGTTKDVLMYSANAYTKKLIESAPAFEIRHACAASSHESDKRPSVYESSEPAVEWKNVSKVFKLRDSKRLGRTSFTALDDVNLTARKGTTLAVVGESGSGKSTLLRLALGLISPSHGTALVNGIDIAAAHRLDMRQARRYSQLVQQNPYASLDPHMDVLSLISEPLKAFHMANGKERRRRVNELLEKVALPQSVLKARATELSGGQCQRVAIARALSIRPKTLFLDEPVSALDTTVQAQIMKLLITLQKELGLSYVFVSHDLAVVNMIAHDVAVLRHGRVVEFGRKNNVLSHPASPYTRKFIESIPGRHV